MILNIVDRRKKEYRWKRVNAVLENTHQDNSCKDSDIARKDAPHQLTYSDRKGISLTQAIEWGMEQDAEVTLYLYDDGAGIS